MILLRCWHYAADIRNVTVKETSRTQHIRIDIWFRLSDAYKNVAVPQKALLKAVDYIHSTYCIAFELE